MVWPSASTRRAVSRCAASWSPIMKNVACTRSRRRTSSTASVFRPGPSSKVSATVRLAVAGAVRIAVLAGLGQVADRRAAGAGAGRAGGAPPWPPPVSAAPVGAGRPRPRPTGARAEPGRTPPRRPTAPAARDEVARGGSTPFSRHQTEPHRGSGGRRHPELTRTFTEPMPGGGASGPSGAEAAQPSVRTTSRSANPSARSGSAMTSASPTTTRVRASTSTSELYACVAASGRDLAQLGEVAGHVVVAQARRAG